MSHIGKSLLKGAEEALEYAYGKKKDIKIHKIKVPESIDVRAIRNRLAMTRTRFSREFGLSGRTVEKWERGERIPEEAARAYLTVIAENPNAVRQALAKHARTVIQRIMIKRRSSSTSAKKRKPFKSQT